jgi:transcriptional regulator with XRE-family HTH domain
VPPTTRGGTWRGPKRPQAIAGEPVAGMIEAMDDVRAGRTIRAMRLRLGWTQRYLGQRSEVSQQEISVLERGHLDRTPLRVVRAVVRALDGSAEIDIRWRGGALGRLLDSRHAALTGLAANLIADAGWEVAPEITYSEFGERGSIDLAAWHASARTLLVVEIKSELTSLEATLRKHDEKVRLAPTVVAARFAWHPSAVARLLVLPDVRTAHRRVALAGPVLDRAYPIRGWTMRRWLRVPAGRGDGLIYLPGTTGRGGRRAVDR